MAQSMSSSRRAVILTTLQLEYKAVLSYLSNPKEETHNGTIYESGYFQAAGQTWLVGIAQIGSGNNVTVAAATERAIAHFKPSVVMYVGIAGGLKDVKIGDVIAASKVYGYESGKASTIFEPRPEIGQPTHALEQRAMAEAKKNDWLQRIKPDTPSSSHRVYVGPIAAGEKVIATLHSETAQFLQRNYSDALAVEMEGYGFLKAMYANQHVDTLIIRGISNIITDQQKTDNITHQDLAARHASAFAFEILAKFQANNSTMPTSISKKIKTAREKIRVLAAFANPFDTSRLQLDVEERTIRQAIERGKGRDNIYLRTLQAATFSDVSRALLNERFQIVHVSSHGNGQGLIFADDRGRRSLQGNQKTLQQLFLEYSDTIQCVILNACYSRQQGVLIAQHIPYTIVMDNALYDEVAIQFSEGFYDAITAGKSIEHAYREGNRRVENTFPHTLSLPLLLKKGEVLPEEDSHLDANFDEIEPLHIKNTKALVGVALDLSASIQKSFINQSGNTTKRLASIQQAFKELTQAARQGLREAPTDDADSEINMFIYGFGLQSMELCDLLSLWKASKQLITEERIDTTIQQLKNERKPVMQTYEGLGKLIRSFGVRNTADFIDNMTQQVGRQQVRKRIWKDMKGSIESCAIAIGDTTLSIEEIAQWWKESGEMLENAEDLLFGKTTPITNVLKKIIARFERELARREKETQPILLLISDGKFTWSNSLPLIEKLRSMGITILSCLITDKDIADPRQLINQPSEEWSDEARLMFEMASPFKENQDIETFLLRKGWTIDPHPKLFVQANHSDILKEFTRVTLGQFES